MRFLLVTFDSPGSARSAEEHAHLVGHLLAPSASILALGLADSSPFYLIFRNIIHDYQWRLLYTK